MARYTCFACNKNLHGHPKIRVEGEVYCFACAKRIVAIKDRPNEEKYVAVWKDYEAKVARWENWKKNLELALPSKTTRSVIIVGVAIGCAVLLADPIYFLPGLLAGWIAEYFYVQSQKNDWIRNNSEPKFPSYPSINFVRDHIELVGGVSGTQLSAEFHQRQRMKLKTRSDFHR